MTSQTRINTALRTGEVGAVVVLAVFADAAALALAVVVLAVALGAVAAAWQATRVRLREVTAHDTAQYIALARVESSRFPAGLDDDLAARTRVHRRTA
ncbi:hypothetical protein [Glycomyces paridis]|uniref:hypothetical protein n=1 Tax=Glycomyces paridis TaxID=2126555 RepID=UPI001305123B|nr:hypothetical protein [Glycomyces paridis]